MTIDCPQIWTQTVNLEGKRLETEKKWYCFHLFLCFKRDERQEIREKFCLSDWPTDPEGRVIKQKSKLTAEYLTEFFADFAQQLFRRLSLLFIPFCIFW